MTSVLRAAAGWIAVVVFVPPIMAVAIFAVLRLWIWIGSAAGLCEPWPGGA